MSHLDADPAGKDGALLNEAHKAHVDILAGIVVERQVEAGILQAKCTILGFFMRFMAHYCTRL